MAQQPDKIGREVLPIPDTPSRGKMALDARDASFPPIEPLRPPKDAPNVVIVLLDDMGFGAPSVTGGPCNMPAMQQVADDGVLYNRFHTTALCSPTRVALLTGRNHHSRRHRLGGRGGDRRAGQRQRAPEHRRHGRRDAAAQRLQHRLRRQGPPDTGMGSLDVGPVRPLADRRGIREVLRIRRRRDQSVVADPDARHQPDRAAQDGRGGLPLLRGHHRQGDLVDAWPRRDDARQAVLPLRVLRRHPRAPSRVAGVDRQVQGQVRQGLGRGARRDARAT